MERPLPGHHPAQAPARWRRLLRALPIIAGYALVVVGATFAADWLVGLLGMDLKPTTEPLIHRVIMASLMVYVLLMALPFVPGVEIGLALLMLLGADIAPVVYLATVVALTLSYGVGRLVPERLLAKAFTSLGLAQAGRLVEELQLLPIDARVALLLGRRNGGFVERLLRHRHLTLAIAFNIPGNNFIGGGGGISLAAGMSRLVTFPGFLATVVVGTSPVPLAIVLLDAWR